MKRGEIYWVRLDPTEGSEINKTRPCVVLSVNPINRVRRTVVVVPLTSRGPERLPLLVGVNDGRSFVVTDQLRVVSKQRLGNLKGTLDSDDLLKLEEHLKTVLGL